MFRIEMLPAAHGDCIWIEYGSGRAVHRILIDGGPAHTYPSLRERILHLPVDERRFELLVITHIDADHIEGVIRLLQDSESLNCEFERIWFNGREQLNQVPDPAGEPLGALQGEMLGMLISNYEERMGKKVLNTDLPAELAAINRHETELPQVTLNGDCRLTLLSPDYERLLDLKDNWEDELREAGVVSGDLVSLQYKLESARNLQPLGDVLGAEADENLEGFEMPAADDSDLWDGFGDALGGGDGESESDAVFGSDTSKANGSSIAILLEYPLANPKVRFLLAGDAWSEVLVDSINILLPNPVKRLKLTGIKLPHHGSVANITEKLLSRLNCKHYLISTSGALFRHPHTRTVNLLLNKHNGRGKPRLHFNYLSSTTEEWREEKNQQKKKYIAFHPKGISLEL